MKCTFKMPVSHWLPDGTTKKLLSNIKINTFLDIGAGAGKYGKMISKYHPQSKKIGLEIDASYIDEFNLNEIYDEILNFPAIDLIDKAIDSTYDLVIIGDCIEHMKKSEGIDLLNFLVYRSKYILIHYPNEYIQGTVDDHIHEAHISIWHESDFQAFDYKFIKNGFIHTYAIDGYLRKKSIVNKLTNYDKSVLKILS